ncbi:HlyD family efflux transporter periplasmic adaptor subunit [Nocardiopsis sp. NPDC101807]|uniref:HlyD family efflux transporter periplasmic adaptor subunit n=1 Tax=Nocardiopsis sp. NPDC101807 TaxID=3364339 RepID=UPI0038092DFF
MKKWIVIGAVLVVLGGLAGTGYFLLGRLGGPSDEMLMDPSAMDVGGVPVEVEMGAISSVMVLDAVVEAEPGEAVKARGGGTVTHLWVADGAEVEEGAPIVNVRVQAETAPAPGDGEGDAQAPATTETTLYAPTGGTVSGLDDVLVGDVLEPGAAVAEVAPDQFRAVASIPANDLYRFYEDPEDIMLKIDKGPPADACEFLSLGTGGGGGGEDAGGETGEEGAGGDGGSLLTCRVPSDLQVFDGVRGQLSVTTGEAENVLVVPVTSVRGTSEEGEVVVVSGDGSEEVREVRLGMSDGSLVEVTEGLGVGDMIMDPVPLDPRFDVPGAGDTEEDLMGEEG